VMVAGWVVQLCWVVASDHRGHAAHPAPPEKPDATHQPRAPEAVDQAARWSRSCSPAAPSASRPCRGFCHHVDRGTSGLAIRFLRTSLQRRPPSGLASIVQAAHRL
jgi:hypothetical protein